MPRTVSDTYGFCMVRFVDAAVVTEVEADLGEGPVWCGESLTVWWVDITGQRLLNTDPATGVTSSVSVDVMPGSVFVTADGQMLVAGQRGIVLGEEALVLFDPADSRVRANDGKVDPQGRIVVGTMGLDAEPGLGSLFRIDPSSRSCERLLGDLTISNGLAWSADGAAMFHIDSPTQRVMRYDYPTLGPGEVVVEIPRSSGTPDGMTIDAEGCLWVALWGGGAVHRYRPDGTLDTVVTVPASNVTCCTFGGPDLDQLFITSARSEWSAGDLGGSLFMCAPGVSGLAAHRVR